MLAATSIASVSVSRPLTSCIGTTSYLQRIPADYRGLPWIWAAERVCCPNRAEDFRLHLPLEVAVNERLHRREIQRSTETPDHRPEDDDGGQTLRAHHRDRAPRVPDEASDVDTRTADAT